VKAAQLHFTAGSLKAMAQHIQGPLCSSFAATSFLPVRLRGFLLWLALATCPNALARRFEVNEAHLRYTSAVTTVVPLAVPTSQPWGGQGASMDPVENRYSLLSCP